jgi:hypothetical protein
LAIQQYDVHIAVKRENDIKGLISVMNNNYEGSNSVPIAEIIHDIEKYGDELDECRQSVQEMRLSNRESISKHESFVSIVSPKPHSSNMEYADENFEVLQNQLIALNLKPLEYIPLYKIRERLRLLTDAMNRGEIIDENEFDHLLRCMDVNKEYIQEKKEKEREWREKISTYAEECLTEQRRFIPPDIFTASTSQLVHEKGIPAALAKRLMQKKCLWLIRMSESYISKLHYADLLGKYSVEGNNLDIVETLAIYASVPVKFLNDGNGKKALWRKSLDDIVKKLMASKENRFGVEKSCIQELYWIIY